MLVHAGTSIQNLTVTSLSDEEFLYGLQQKTRYIEISEMTMANRWDMFNYLIYNHMPQAFFYKIGFMKEKMVVLFFA